MSKVGVAAHDADIDGGHDVERCNNCSAEPLGGGSANYQKRRIQALSEVGRW